MFRRDRIASLRRLSAGAWVCLITLGLLFYSVTQGAQFLSLFYLPAVSTMLFQITILAWIFLNERVTWREGLGMALAVIGVVIVQDRRRRARTPLYPNSH